MIDCITLGMEQKDERIYRVVFIATNCFLITTFVQTEHRFDQPSIMSLFSLLFLIFIDFTSKLAKESAWTSSCSRWLHHPHQFSDGTQCAKYAFELVRILQLNQWIIHIHKIHSVHPVSFNLCNISRIWTISQALLAERLRYPRENKSEKKNNKKTQSVLI